MVAPFCDLIKVVTSSDRRTGREEQNFTQRELHVGRFSRVTERWNEGGSIASYVALAANRLDTPASKLGCAEGRLGRCSRRNWPPWKRGAPIILGRCKKFGRGGDRFRQAGAFDRDPGRKGAEQAGRHHRVQQNESAAVVGAPDQPAEGLLEPQAHQHIVIAPAAEGLPPGLVEN